MRDQPAYQRPGGRFFLLLIVFGLSAATPPGRAAGTLPFDPAQICRLSIDDIPRSVSIRQGADVWFGYDLEKALVFKVWQAAKGKPGVILKSFKAQSAGAAMFEGKKAEGWLMKIDGKNVPLSIRYLGCTQNKDYFELRWELAHPDGTIKLSERIARAPAKGSPRAHRELRVESVPRGVSLELPAVYREAWQLTGPDGNPVKSFTGPAWHQLSLR